MINLTVHLRLALTQCVTCASALGFGPLAVGTALRDCGLVLVRPGLVVCFGIGLWPFGSGHGPPRLRPRPGPSRARRLPGHRGTRRSPGPWRWRARANSARRQPRSGQSLALAVDGVPADGRPGPWRWPSPGIVSLAGDGLDGCSSRGRRGRGAARAGRGSGRCCRGRSARASHRRGAATRPVRGVRLWRCRRPQGVRNPIPPPRWTRITHAPADVTDHIRPGAKEEHAIRVAHQRLEQTLGGQGCMLSEVLYCIPRE